MAAQKSTAPSGAVLPPITVARFEEVGYLIERLVAANTDVFIAAGQQYRERHRAGTSRALTATEVAAIASALSVSGREHSLQEVKEQIDAAGLQHYDEPAAAEYMLAAGVATAPAFVKAMRHVVALVEMPADEFQIAREDGSLPDAIEVRSATLDDLPLDEARERAKAAMLHVANGAGVNPGKAQGLLSQSMVQSLQQAMTVLTNPAASVSSTFSPGSTDGAGERSSTTLGTPTH